jgi:hypothetical protein
LPGFWLSFDPDIRTQAIFRLDVSALCRKGEEDAVKLSSLVGERDGAGDVGWAVPFGMSVLAFFLR